jgi:hypothetical protein
VRAISTVLDASLCLLLVSASAVTLAGTPTDGLGVGPHSATGPDTADRTAELLATSTARVAYESADGSAKTTHDTLAGLLASAANTDARGTPPDFVRAVTAEVNNTLRQYSSADLGVQVVARSTNESTARHRITAGKYPPPTTDVHAARLELREAQLTVRTWSA